MKEENQVNELKNIPNITLEVILAVLPTFSEEELMKITETITAILNKKIVQEEENTSGNEIYVFEVDPIETHKIRHIAKLFYKYDGIIGRKIKKIVGTDSLPNPLYEARHGEIIEISTNDGNEKSWKIVNSGSIKTCNPSLLEDTNLCYTWYLIWNGKKIKLCTLDQDNIPKILIITKYLKGDITIEQLVKELGIESSIHDLENLESMDKEEQMREKTLKKIYQELKERENH